MKKLSIFASIGAALLCVAVPASFNWSPGNVTLFSLDRAEARLGRPLTPMSVAGVSRRVHRREYRRAVAAGAAVGIAAPMSGDLPQLTSPDPRLNLDLQSPDRPGLRSPDLPR
jgi:hypothetical protein